jgi:RHS repeat-associated protein
MNRAALALCLLVGGSLCAEAHELYPPQLTLKYPGRSAILTLSNASGETNCTTVISITVDGNAVKVDPLFGRYETPPDALATFTVTPLRVGTARITVNWNAGTSPSCNGSGSPQVPVTVVSDLGDPPPPPVYEKQVIEPISMANGAFSNTYLDIRLRGPLPIYFERYYNSGLEAEGQAASALGPNWIHNYDVDLITDGVSARVTYPYGQSIRFTQSGGVWTQSTKDPLSYQLLESGAVYRMLDPFTHLVYTFDGDTGRLQTIRDRAGNTQTLTYANGRLSRVSDGMGATLDFTYDAEGGLTKVADHSGRSVAFTYTQGTLASCTDVAGRTTTFTYGTGARMTTYRLPRGNSPYSNTYDSSGRVTSQRDATANAFSFAYGPTPGVSTMTNPLAQISTYTHVNRNLTRETDPAGNSSTMVYDTNNRQTSRTDRAGRTTTFSFNSNGLVASTATADGTTSYGYTSSQANGFTFFDLTSAVYPDGSSESFEYDSSGNVVTRVNRAGQRWLNTYNSHGQPLTLTAPNGAKTVFTYTQDSASTLSSVQSPDTSVVNLRYDSLKRLLSKQRSDGATASYTYDAYDNVLTVTDEVGAVTTYTYDANGLLASVKDPMGTTTITRTATDKIATVTDGAGRVFTIRYDALDRPASLIYGDGSTFQIGYDASGNAVTFTDGEGKVWRHGYDKAGIETSITTPLGNQTTFTLDGMGRPTTAITAGGKNVRFAYDAIGRLKAITDPLQQESSFQYDKNGELTAWTIPGGLTASYTRDALGNLTGITDPRGSKWTFTNDGIGRALSSTDPLGQTITYTRDARGRISQVNSPLGTLTPTLDAAGRLVNARYSDTTSIDFQWNAAGRLTSGTGLTMQYDAAGLPSNSNGLAIARDPAGRVSGVTLASGKAISYTYDRRGLLTGVSDWLGGTTTLKYDDDSRLVSITRPNGVATSYTYDADGDVAAVREAGASQLSSISLTRDKRGYVIQAERDVPLTATVDQLKTVAATHTYDAAGQIAEFQYDKLGRRIADDSRSYTWDLASRLTGYTGGGESRTFTHNALGLLTSQTRSGVTRQFVWNLASPLPWLAVVRSAGTDLTYYVHTPDGRLLYGIDANGKRRYQHYDEMGNTIFVTDDSGAVTDKFAYSPYGALLAPASSDELFLFAGQYGVLHVGNGLYAARQRVYDSRAGAFLSRDPNFTLSPLLVTPYSYAAGNPLHFFDITGAAPDTTAAGVADTTISTVNNVGGAADIVANTFINGKVTDAENVANTLAKMKLPEGTQGANVLKEGQEVGKAMQKAKDLKKIAKPLNAAGKLGTAANVVSVGIESYKFNNAINQVESEDDRNRQGNEQTYQTSVAELHRLYDEGKISAVQRNRMMLQVRWAYEDAMLATDYLLETNLVFEGFVYFKNGLGTFVPVPLNWIGLAPEEKLKAK